jgi:hypothetical protein
MRLTFAALAATAVLVAATWRWLPERAAGEVAAPPPAGAANAESSANPAPFGATASRSDHATTTAAPRPPDAARPAAVNGVTAVAPPSAAVTPAPAGIAAAPPAAATGDEAPPQLETPAELAGFSDELMKLHKAFQSQPRNASWADRYERTIWKFVNRSAVEGFDATSIECRSTLCELRISAASGAPSRDWQEMVKKMQARRWWGRMGGVSWDVSPQDGQSILAVFHSAGTAPDGRPLPP